MIIFSNEYLSNLPKSKHPAKGGPANFAKRFKKFLKGDKTKHRWIGIIFQCSQITAPKLKKILTSNQETYYLLNLPRDWFKKIEQAKKPIDPEKIFAPAINSIARILTKSKSEIVFLNGYALTNWLILRAAAQANIPIAIQHAGIWTKELEMYKDFFSSAGKKMMKEMEQEISKLASAEIFLNDFSRRFYVKNVAHPQKNKTHIIPLPLDFDNYYYSRHPRWPHNNIENLEIGIISRWDRIKNHEAILALAKEASRRKLPWRFYAVTTIPDTSKKKQFKSAYRKYVKLVPPLDQKGVEKFCQLSDLIIVPSHFDVSPNVVLESVACGTPVAISTNVGFVDDFKSCDARDWIIDFSNPTKAIKAIDKITGKKMPSTLVRNLKNKHKSSRVFKSYLRLFKKLTNDQKKK